MSSRYAGKSVEWLQQEHVRLQIHAIALELEAPVLGQDRALDQYLDDVYARLDAIDALLREQVAR